MIPAAVDEERDAMDAVEFDGPLSEVLWRVARYYVRHPEAKAKVLEAMERLKDIGE